MLALELDDQSLDALALQAQIAACRTAAANDRQIVFARVGARFRLGDIHQRPNHDVLAVVRHQPRRHGLECAGEEQIQQQRLDEIVQMVAERDLRGADLARASR